MVEYHLFLPKTSHEYTNSDRKSYQVISLVMSCMRGESGKETFWSQTLKNWSRWTPLNCTPKAQCKGSVNANEMWKFHVPSRRWNSQNFWGDQRLRTSTFIRDRPDEEKDKEDCWSVSGYFVHRLHVEPGVKLYVPREESFPIPLEYVDVTRTTRTTWDVMLETYFDDYWNVDGDRELSDTWTGFFRFTILSEMPPGGYTWSGKRLTRKQSTSQPDKLWPDM